MADAIPQRSRGAVLEMGVKALAAVKVAAKPFARIIGKTAAADATTSWQFMPHPAPEIIPGAYAPEGMATDTVINMALLEMINEPFSQELAALTAPDGNPLVIRNQDRSLVSVDCGDKVTRTFRKISALVDENDTGAKAIAFEEVALPYGTDIHYMSEASRDRLPLAPGAAVRVLVPVNYLMQSQRSPQILPIETFVNEKIIPYLKGRHEPVEVQLFAHSTGSSSAEHAEYMLDGNANISTLKTVLFEPFFAGTEMRFLLQEAMERDPQADPADVFNHLTRNKSTIRVYPPTDQSQVCSSYYGDNKEVGASYKMGSGYWDDTSRLGQLEGGAAGAASTVVVAEAGVGALKGIKHLLRRDKTPQEPAFSRRSFGAALIEIAAAGVIANAASYGGGKFNGANDTSFHDIALT